MRVVCRETFLTSRDADTNGSHDFLCKLGGIENNRRITIATADYNSPVSVLKLMKECLGQFYVTHYGQIS